jgi:hypothetical protein
MTRFTAIPTPIAIVLLLASCGSTTGNAGDDLALQQKYAGVPVYHPGGGMKPPQVLRRIDPTPSDFMRSSRHTADATVEAVIDGTGVVVAAWYVEGDREWAKSVAMAVRSWRFSPATLDGKPVEVRFKVSSTFRGP